VEKIKVCVIQKYQKEKLADNQSATLPSGIESLVGQRKSNDREEGENRQIQPNKRQSLPKGIGTVGPALNAMLVKNVGIEA
tara:strand:+ start:29 stop:271 length:243 start_codon:yes stop_codon:yes gene_type:complete